VKYFYTLDGTEPTLKSNQYLEPLRINKSSELKMIATMEGWIDSEVVVHPLLKLGIKPDRVILETMPDPKFSGRLDSTLVDGRSGSLDRSDKEYLGFTTQDFQALFQMDKPQKLSQVTMSFLEDIDKGVMAPEYMEIWGGVDKNNLKKLGIVKTDPPEFKKPAAKKLLRVDFPQELLML
jgi:hypothetical protein